MAPQVAEPTAFAPAPKGNSDIYKLMAIIAIATVNRPDVLRGTYAVLLAKVIIAAGVNDMVLASNIQSHTAIASIPGAAST